jgi:hypothetical protein
MHAIIDHKKWFLDVFVVLLGSMNDTKVLCIILNLPEGHVRGSFNEHTSHDDFKSYLIGDKGYPLSPWLMVLQNHTKMQHSVLETLYNK